MHKHKGQKLKVEYSVCSTAAACWPWERTDGGFAQPETVLLCFIIWFVDLHHSYWGTSNLGLMGPRRMGWWSQKTCEIPFSWGSSSEMPAVGKDVSLLWFLLPRPNIFQGMWRGNAGKHCLPFSLSQTLCKCSDIFKYHKQDCYSSSPTDSPEDSRKVPDTQNEVPAQWRTSIRTQKEPLRLQEARSQVHKHHKTYRSQKITKCVAIL